MLRLEFNEFQKTIEEERQSGNYPTVHCMTEIDKFTFIIKNEEEWEYYTIMLFDDIVRYAQQKEIDPKEAFDMFVTNYCTHTKPIEPPDMIILHGEMTEDDIKETSLNKSEEIDAGEDVIDESEEYSDLFKNVLNRWEKKVVNSLSKIDIQKDNAYINKTFGEFLQNLLNAVNTTPFLKRIRFIITNSMKEGLDSVEEELDMDIGFTVDHRKQAKIFENQQLNGYLINGKRWHGIKGATKQLQFNILKEVEQGVRNKKDLKEITKDVKKVFTTAKDGQAVRIARTETNRFVNQSKLTSYEKSNIVKGKQWSTHIDSRTGDLDKRLNGQKQPLDEPFVDSVTGLQFMYPPAHPNCRCTLKSVLKKVQ